MNWGYLLTDCARQLRRRFDERMRAEGLTGPQARFLLLLDVSEGRPQAYYAGELDVEPITLGRMADRMEEAGMIERQSDPTDRRARRVFLTDRARRIVDRLRDSTATLLGDIEAAIEEDEKDLLVGLLARLSARLTNLNCEECEEEVLANGRS